MATEIRARSEESVVLTGATGFVGSLTLERLLARGARVTALVRAPNDAAARERLDQLALRTWGDESMLADVCALAADLEHQRLGLHPAAYDALAADAAAIVHCAASVRFDLPLDRAEAINASGTQRIVELVQRAQALRGETRLVHVSTAYVHGRMKTLARESGPSQTPEFRNSYERSKHSAERFVSGLGNAAIVRPSIVVGDSDSGWTSSFNVIYPPLRALINGDLQVVPAPADAILDIVPVDQVVDVICALLDDPSINGVIQAVSGELAPTIEQLAQLTYRYAGLPMTKCVPSEVDQIGVYAPYVDVRARFEFRRAAELGVRPLPIEDLLPVLLDFASVADWGRKRLLRRKPAFACA